MIDNVTHEYYCSFEICQLLKKAGFDWKCRCYYDKSGKLRGLESAPHKTAYDHNDARIWQNNGNGPDEMFSAPLVATAVSWLHENFGMEINVRHMVNPKGIETLSLNFNHVYITNSYKNWKNLPDNVEVVDILDEFYK